MADVVSLKPARKSGARSPGRPPKTSRQEIVACVVAILEKNPQQSVSITQIAREIGIAPMAIYNYFANRDELLQTVTQNLMEEFRLELAEGADWRAKITAWAHATHRHFRRYPHLIHLLTWEGHTSVAWLKHSAIVTEALADVGLAPRELAPAVLWVWSSIMGAVNSELSWASSHPTLSDEDLARMEEPLRGHMRALRDFTAGGGHFDSAFQYNLERTLDGLAGVIAKAQSKAV
jgi:AcrR family transcriptional regulator